MPSRISSLAVWAAIGTFLLCMPLFYTSSYYNHRQQQYDVAGRFRASSGKEFCLVPGGTKSFAHNCNTLTS
jgi:hypothetical protein